MSKPFLVSFIIFLLLAFAFFYFLLFVPFHFSPITIDILPETSLEDISFSFSRDHLINSPSFFRIIAKLEGKDTSIIPGEYLFSKKESIFGVLARITSGDFKIPQTKVVLPEGLTNLQMARLIKLAYPDFDPSDFTNYASKLQGYLFPDTYFFKGSSTAQIIAALQSNFEIQTEPLRVQAESEGKDWNEIVTVASILEEEGNNKNDYSIIAGILEKRLSLGIALQVDSDPTTYKQKGLPLEPISNPGIDALSAALNPTQTGYLYYLTGKDGMMHYAKTYAEHLKNKKKYL